MTTQTLPPAASLSPRRLRQLMQMLLTRNAFIYLCFSEEDAGVFVSRRGISTLTGRISKGEVAALVERETVVEYSRSRRGVRYTRVAQQATRRRTSRPPTTAADRRHAKFLEAERFFKDPSEAAPRAVTVNLGESPLGWLSRRKNADGRAFLTEAEVAAGERLRADFERAQLSPGVTQDWRRFLTPGGTGAGLSAQERAVGGSAEAARERVMEALADLGPGLSDAALRICCFLEGLETVETAMSWSARSGKIVLKIALQRLIEHYDRVDPKPESGEIRVWRASAS